VSVGEIHLLTGVVQKFRARFPHRPVVISSTTDTGLAEAQARFPDLTVIPFPFDFSWACAASLDALRPVLIVLAESELWPNFLEQARQRQIPVAVINARVSPRSSRRLQRVQYLAYRLLLKKVRMFAVQTTEYAERLELLGVPRDRIMVTGSVKYDGAITTQDEHKVASLRHLLGLTSTSVVWLAGSTHAPEEEIVLRVFAALRIEHPELRLILVPRHPDRFPEVWQRVQETGLSAVRRSTTTIPLPEAPAVILLDTVGELGTAWGLATVGFTGGSLDGKRGGQSMIEPAGYGVPVIFGPHIWNFKDAANRLIDTGGAIKVQDEQELQNALSRLLTDEELRIRMGQAAQELVRTQQGATAKTLAVIEQLI
jgi:3-deoxy-D-manno-octulosonic-acid transferase